MTPQEKKDTSNQDITDDPPDTAEADVDADKASESELREQRCQDAQLMDKEFAAWQDKKITKGTKGWEKHANMCCDQGETLKDQQQCDLTGPPTDYMKSWDVFKASKTNA